MKKISINGNLFEFEGDKTILDVAKENGIEIPTLCYLKDCDNKGKCGVCLVEVEGKKTLKRSCSMSAQDGMVVRNDTENVKEAVKSRIAEMLEEHYFRCGACKRKENCEFFKLVIKTKARAAQPFKVHDIEEYIDDRSKAIVIDRSKCIKCGRCAAACKTKTGTCSVDFMMKDGKSVIASVGDLGFDNTNCLLCGQCVTACPVDAIYEKSHIERVKNALEDPEKHVIVAMAPAVRASIGELFGMGFGVDVTKKLYSALRELGFDKIFDINFGADMTIMEEATEFIKRIKNNGPFPMFTSCCPSWVRLVEKYHPEFLNNLSSAKSPQQIFGSATKTYYPELVDIDPSRVFTVTIMPCTSKKFEADREEMSINGLRQIDAVLTTRELAKLIKDNKIKFKDLEDSEVDSAMGEYSGAGAIFGVTGGVMEAALRTAKDFIENEDLENVDYKMVRGLAGIKEATVKLDGKEYNVAVINGSKSLFEFIESDKMKEKQYHFIEVMNCEGGCVNGGGQPHLSSAQREKIDIKTVRGSVLYNQDEHLIKRKSHKNEALKKMYENYMGQPGGEKAEELLHFKYTK